MSGMLEDFTRTLLSTHMKLLNNFFFDFVLVVSIFFLDRISKIYVINFSQNNLNNNILNSKYLDLTLIWNEGIAFGLMSFDNNHYYNILTGIIIIITLIVLIIGLQNKGLKRYSLLSIFAGSLGNLYDRLFYNAVPDFIDFHVNNFHWFIFNVADIFISFGVIIMIMTEFFVKKGELDA